MAAVLCEQSGRGGRVRVDVADDACTERTRVVNVFVHPSHVSVPPCQLDRPLVRPISIRVTRR